MTISRHQKKLGPVGTKYQEAQQLISDKDSSPHEILARFVELNKLACTNGAKNYQIYSLNGMAGCHILIANDHVSKATRKVDEFLNFHLAKVSYEKCIAACQEASRILQINSSSDDSFKESIPDMIEGILLEVEACIKKVQKLGKRVEQRHEKITSDHEQQTEIVRQKTEERDRIKEHKGEGYWRRANGNPPSKKAVERQDAIKELKETEYRLLELTKIREQLVVTNNVGKTEYERLLGLKLGQTLQVSPPPGPLEKTQGDFKVSIQSAGAGTAGMFAAPSVDGGPLERPQEFSTSSSAYENSNGG